MTKRILTGSITKNPTDLQQGSVTDQNEDRSAYLRSDDIVTWTGTQLTFTANITLEILNTASGTLTQHNILVAGSPVSIADGESIYVVIDRTSASESLTLINSGATPIPAQTDANKDTFIIVRRVDVGGLAYLHIPLHKQLIGPSKSVRLGEMSGQARAGTDAIASGVAFHAVTLSSAMVDTDYAVDCKITNTVDSNPQIQPIVITVKGTAGFTASWSDDTDSANYQLEYLVKEHQ